MSYKKLMIGLFVILFVHNTVHSMFLGLDGVFNNLRNNDSNSFINPVEQKVSIENSNEKKLAIYKIMQKLQKQSNKKEEIGFDALLDDRPSKQKDNNKKRKNSGTNQKAKKKRKSHCTVEQCDFRYDSEVLFRLHTRWHERNGHPCDTCRIAYRHRESFNNHIIERHSSDLDQKEIDLYKSHNNNKQCKEVECTFTPKTESQVKAHKRWHARKGFPCTACPLAYPNYRALSNHKKSHQKKLII